MLDSDDLSDQVDHLMQVERYSLSKETPQKNFQDLREVVGNYFHNVARFVILHQETDYQQTNSSEK